MVIPMPFAAPMQQGPPTQCAVDQRWKLIALLILQGVHAAGAFAMNDFVNGILQVLLVCLGAYGVMDLDIRILLFWAMIGIMSGVYAIAAFIDFFFKGHGFDVFRSHDPRLIFIASTIFIGPFCFLPPLYYVYKMFRAMDEEGPTVGGAQPGDAQRQYTERSSILGNEPRRSNFVAFSGEGQRLGAD